MKSSKLAVDSIINRLELLEYGDYFKVLEIVIRLMKEKETRSNRSNHSALTLRRAQGLGKDLWQKKGGSSYLSKERSSWS